jgi:RNA polymerase primary sigma factor
MTDAGKLTAWHERDLVIATEAGDLDACRRLVEAFLPAIAGVARRFPNGVGVERRELVQEGVAGLLLAARRYDSALNTPFWAYASFWVRKAMQELMAELTGPVGLSDRAVRGLAAIRTARNDHLRDHGGEPTTEELMTATGFTRRQVETLQAAHRIPRSLEERPPATPDGTGTIGDRIADASAEWAYEQVLDKIEIHEVRSLADQLGERERTVILAHYGVGQPAQTLSRIAATLGLTAERARQIEVAALSKLRNALAQPAPAQPTPAQPAPAQPTPAQPTPAQPAPAGQQSS